MSTVWNKIFRWVGVKKTIFNEANADGTGTEQDVSQWGWLEVEVCTTGFTGTIKFYSSLSTVDGVNFANAASKDNPYGAIAFYDLENPAAVIAGNTGKAYAADTGVHIYTINQTAAQAFCAKISGYAAGTVTVRVRPVNNQ